MKLIRTATGDHIRDGSAAPAELGSVGVRENRDFLDRLEVCRLEALSFDEVVVIVLTIDQKVVRAWTLPVYGKIHAVRESTRHGVSDPGLSECELNWI